MTRIEQAIARLREAREKVRIPTEEFGAPNAELLAIDANVWLAMVDVIEAANTCQSPDLKDGMHSNLFRKLELLATAVLGADK